MRDTLGNVGMLRDFFYRGYLAEGEEIVFVIHRHIFIQAKDFVRITFFGIFIPIFAWWLFPQVFFFSAVWLAIGLIRFVYEFFDWYFDVWLATNQSVVEIMWEGFFKKSSARIEYHTIQGIGYDVTGLMRTIFNFGNVMLEKFAGNPSVFDGAVNPRRKAEMLTQAQEQFVRNKNFRDHHTLQGLLTDLLQKHVVDHGVPHGEEEMTE